MTNELRELAIERASADAIRRRCGGSRACRLLAHDGFDKVRAGHHLDRRGRKGNGFAPPADYRK